MQQNNLIMKHQAIKELPYGVSNFVTIVEENIYYVDKTMYIPMLENEARNLFFIRPRRFGKSLFLGMLHAYYDCRTRISLSSGLVNCGLANTPHLIKDAIKYCTLTSHKWEEELKS